MSDSSLDALSRFLSYVLRHRPDAYALPIDREGWVAIDALKEAGARAGWTIDAAILARIVDSSAKRRFALSDDGRSIRALQGHSTRQVALRRIPVTPPGRLFHGTATRFVASILEHGLRPGRRHHVHLSTDYETAVAVGRRHGKPVVFAIRAAALAQAGVPFFRAENGVWLTERVAPEFLHLLDSSAES